MSRNITWHARHPVFYIMNNVMCAWIEMLNSAQPVRLEVPVY